MQAAIDISADDMDNAAQELPRDQPIMMINLLRFRGRTEYAENENDQPCSGRDAYMNRYAAISLQVVEKFGGKAFWQGQVLATLVAPQGEQWDEALLVQYPDFAAINSVFNDPDYQAVLYHRTAALADSRLIALAIAD
ncbi:DUF1330 domain-containing protein [Novosphingobium sp. 9U]|uniref:DUF1330 domain-containing protein n=1 Tax=Novosphingobium sp. 9U TaxID=2653158 RepID=UPI0012F2D472|nr:DUF1330 domain-containing protein [Novosphingobium sp. 9U]VWX49981.1 conserved hypothetical protein [Novosphingobium sp. 9U]